MSTTEWKGFKPPGFKNIDGYTPFVGDVPVFIKNTALRFLQIVYATKASLRYEEDDEKTQIKIADQNAFQLTANDTRPAIIAVRGTINWNNVGLNMGMQSKDMRTGKTESSDLLSGSVAFSCLSRVGLEAEAIATEVFNLFKFFRPTLMKYGFFSIKSMSIGPEQLIEAPGEPDLSLVSVLLSCQVQESWVLEPKAAAELRKLVIQGLTDNEQGEEIKMFETEISINDQGDT